MIISNHIPALQVLIPFFAALISALSFNKFISWLIATISMVCASILSIYAISFASEGISYDFGNWTAPIGIEYKLDILNQPIIIFFNFVLLFFLLFGKELTSKTILKYIDEKNQHIFYALLLFAHAGYIGIISTNDLFNIYVFIEISSLSTYVLMSKGRTPRSLVGALNYLIMGTIGATLILIAIGFFFAMTGSLNITDISSILKGVNDSKLIPIAVSFFLSGAILKMAFFPMHFWMTRAYLYSSPFILTYLAAIPGILGIYIILRFFHFIIDKDLIYNNLTTIIRYTALITILICTFFALRSNHLKKIVIYSTSSQIGYIFLLMSIWKNHALLFQFAFLDAINKIALFTIIAHIESKIGDLNFENFKSIQNSTLFKILVIFALIFSCSLPLTSMFMVKVKLLELLVESRLFIELMIVITASMIALLYHFKISKAIFFSPLKNGTIQIQTKLYGLVAIVIIQILSLIYHETLTGFILQTESLILGVEK